MFRHKFSIQSLILLLALYIPLASNAQWEDQHSTEALVAALQSAIPDHAVSEAREFDDQLMATGELEGSKVYLVTDARSIRVNTMVRKLLAAMEEDSDHWVVRVLDTDPPVENAFVTGGKYIYVFTGLIEKASGDDELGFVLGHELGHSLLQHNERRKDDANTTIAGLLALGALLAGGDTEENLALLSTAFSSSYSQIDEQEADAIGVAIAARAGFDPLRGADFFSRGIREDAKTQQEWDQTLLTMHQGVLQAQANCKAWLEAYNGGQIADTQENTNKVNAVCAEAEQKRVQYNQLNSEVYTARARQQLDQFTSTHPESQSRVATVAALTDFIHGRRDLSSLSSFDQGYRVMVALMQVESVLLQPPEEKTMSAELAPAIGNNTEAAPSLAEQLSQLKQVYDQGLISKDEYEEMRQNILDRF